MSKGLHIADELTLPIDAVTQTIAILAKRRAGKSYTMRRFAEQLFKAGQQIAMIDPKGDQWGIRSSADGKSPGLPVIILGGERGDVPLEPSSGEIVAKLVVEDRVSVLLDLSLFRKHEVATFMTAFLENLYRLKAREIYRTPLMLVIDEADAVAPQKPQKGEERMLGAAEDIVRRGGQRGIGCVLVTQRSAVLNKNVLTQAQMMVALRTIAPQDLSAMDAWIQVHGEPDQRKTLMESLPSLPVGDAWFWSPGWPTVEGIFKRVHVLPIETFDSGATPKPGVKPVEPKNLADVDLDALKNQMSATIQRAKENDPDELKRTIVALKKELAHAQKATPARVETKPVEVPVLGKDAENLLEKVNLVCDEVYRRQQERAEELQQLGHELKQLRLAVQQKWGHQIRHQARELLDRTNQTHRTPAPEPRRQTVVTSSPTNGSLPKAEKKILHVLANFPDGKTRREIGVISGYKHSGGGFNNALSNLRANGFVEGSDPLRITDAGLHAYGPVQPLPTGEDLYQYWMQHPDLGKAEREILRVLFTTRRAMPKEEIAPLTISDRGTPYEANGGGFNNAVSKLRTYELIDGGRGELKIAEVFFE